MSIWEMMLAIYRRAPDTRAPELFSLHWANGDVLSTSLLFKKQKTTPLLPPLFLSFPSSLPIDREEMFPNRQSINQSIKIKIVVSSLRLRGHAWSKQ